METPLVDPANITNYNQNQFKLEEVLIFWLCVAGKPATVISKALEALYADIENECSLLWRSRRPLQMLASLGRDNIGPTLKKYGIGCHGVKSRGIWELYKADYNLQVCSLEDLTSITGIGPKTARCFLIHSRADCEYAGLDTHVLKFLRSLGCDVPKQTPSNMKQYRRIELIFVNLAKAMNVTIASLDLDIWRAYSSGNQSRIDYWLSQAKPFVF